MKKTSVTIGIPAYQSEANISNLLTSLMKQKQKNIDIENIIVYSDGSKDRTAKNAKSINSKRIKVIDSKKNKGFAYAFNYLLKANRSDVFVELNDDIRIDSEFVIEEIVKPFRSYKNVGLVSGNIKALEPKSLIGQCIYTSYLVFLPLRLSYMNGETDLTCDGKILALSKDFAKSLKLESSKVGNVDIYLYYENLRQKRLYKFAKKATVFFRLPESLRDFKNQEKRSVISRNLMQKNFGELFLVGHKISKLAYLKSALSVFLRYPLQTFLFKLLVNRSSVSGKKSSIKWKLALTTKKLSLLFSDYESFWTTTL